jgi:hypothetical protein
MAVSRRAASFVLVDNDDNDGGSCDDERRTKVIGRKFGISRK